MNKVWTRKAPNHELFRLVRFAIRFPGWHPYDSSLGKHINRGVALGLLEKSNKHFRLASSNAKFQCDPNDIHDHNPLNPIT